MWRFAETNREKRRKIRRKVYAFHLTDFWDSRSLYVRASACVEISQRNASILLTADRQFWSALKLGADGGKILGHFGGINGATESVAI